jgi:DNA-binding CsgD family transcriptional regulator
VTRKAGVLAGRRPKLTDAQVEELRRWGAYGTSVSEVSRRLGVNRKTIYCYLRGSHKRRWPGKTLAS